MHVSNPEQPGLVFVFQAVAITLNGSTSIVFDWLLRFPSILSHVQCASFVFEVAAAIAISLSRQAYVIYARYLQ